VVVIRQSRRTFWYSKQRDIELMPPNIEDIQTRRITSSGLICDRPCWVFSLIGNDYSNTYSLMNVHNGRSTAGTIILDLAGNSNGSDIVVFNQPVYFTKGVYVEFSSNGYSCFVQFVPEY